LYMDSYVLFHGVEKFFIYKGCAFLHVLVHFCSCLCPSFFLMIRGKIRRSETSLKMDLFSQKQFKKWRARWDLNPGSPAPEAYASLSRLGALLLAGPRALLFYNWLLFYQFFIDPPCFGFSSFLSRIVFYYWFSKLLNGF